MSGGKREGSAGKNICCIYRRSEFCCGDDLFKLYGSITCQLKTKQQTMANELRQEVGGGIVAKRKEFWERVRRGRFFQTLQETVA